MKTIIASKVERQSGFYRSFRPWWPTEDPDSLQRDPGGLQRDPDGLQRDPGGLQRDPGGLKRTLKLLSDGLYSRHEGRGCSCFLCYFFYFYFF